jgi:hypothetical protein
VRAHEHEAAPVHHSEVGAADADARARACEGRRATGGRRGARGEAAAARVRDLARAEPDLSIGCVVAIRIASRHDDE